MNPPLFSVLVGLLLSVAAFGAAATPTNNGNTAKAVDPVGVYKWTVPNRNNQLQEVTLTIARDKGNQLTGTLADRSATHPLKDVSFKNEQLTFSVVADTPSGDAVTAYTARFNGEALALTVEKPDPVAPALAAAARAKGDSAAAASADNGTRRSEIAAVKSKTEK